MNRLVQFFILTGVCMMLIGCGINSTTYQNPIPETFTYINQANFNVVRYVTAEVKCTYVLGIGGLSKQNLQTSAINELNKNAELKDNQALVNVNTIISNEFYLGVVTRRHCLASGLVIEFLPEGVTPNAASEYKAEELAASFYSPNEVQVVFNYENCKYNAKDKKQKDKVKANFTKKREKFEDEFVDDLKAGKLNFAKCEGVPSQYASVLKVDVNSVDKSGMIGLKVVYTPTKGKELQSSFDLKKKFGKEVGSWLKKELKKIEKENKKN